MIIAELFAKFGLLPDEKSWDKGHQLVEGLHHALEAYLGYEGLKKVGELVEGTVKAAVEAKHLGERLGITGEAVQELGYAADVTGASAEDMTGAMQRLAMGMEHASKTGSGPLVDALTKLHVPMRNLRHEKLDQNLEEIAEGFKKAPESVNKLGLSMEIFGRSAGPKLLPLLLKGAAGIQELREEAEKLGVVIDQDGIEKAEEFEIAQKRLAATLKGVRNEAVVAIIPALQEMTEGLGKWVQENREAIASGLKAVLEGIAKAFHLIGGAISFVIDLVKDHQEQVGALVIAFIALKAQAIASAIATAAAWVLAMAPIVLVTVAIAGIVMVIKRLVEKIFGVKVTWLEVWHAAIKYGEQFMSWLSALPGRALSWVEGVADSIKQAFADAWNSVVEGAHKAWQKIKDTPVIGHIIRGAQWAGGKASELASAGGKAGFFGQAALAAQASIPAGPGAASASFEANVQADIKIDASGMDPDDLKDAVKGAMKEHTDDMLRQAHSSLAGGKR